MSCLGARGGPGVLGLRVSFLGTPPPPMARGGHDVTAGAGVGDAPAGVPRERLLQAAAEGPKVTRTQVPLSGSRQLWKDTFLIGSRLSPSRGVHRGSQQGAE